MATHGRPLSLLSRVSILVSTAMLVGWAATVLSSRRELPWALAAAGAAGMAGRAVQLSRRVPGASNRIDFARLHGLSLGSGRAWVKQNLRGHDRAVDQLFERLEMNLRLAGPGRTLGTALLVGPTGTGKTFLAQLVSRVLFPKGQPVVIPMNQYKNAQDVITLLGSAGGGHGGSLTTPVREDSHRVILLDEIEKANSDLHHALFDVLDTGETRDKSTGQLLSFGGCLFLGTCNAGVAELRALAASAPEPAVWMGRARDVLATRAGFDKAFLARWDQIIFVDELAPVHVAEVACLQIAQYWRQHGMEVTYASPSAILATIQLNAEFREYGVRQLANLIRAQSEPAILAARDEGYTRVRLEAADGGRLHVSRGTK